MNTFTTEQDWANVETEHETHVPSHEFGNGVRCYDPRPIVWASREDCLHDDSEAQH